MDYYYTDGTNQPKGPVSLAELQELAATGAINASTMVAAVGSDQWSPLASVIPSVAPLAVPPTEPLAIWSLVLSILGLMGCCIASIPAVVLGHLALSSINKKPFVGGRGMATAGLIIGYVTTAFWVLYILFFGGMALIGGLTG
jgi:hypothetical protein